MCGCANWVAQKDETFLQRRQIFVALSFLLTTAAWSQTDIPLGAWRMHISYNAINSIAFSNEKIYAAAESGIVVLDREDNSLTSYSKINGLTGSAISFINYDEVTKQLLVGYEDGNLDIIKENTITNFDRLTDPTIPGSKKINSTGDRWGS